jgi:two-component system chemotaxis response regulator CheY
LIVDDSNATRTLLRQMLAGVGYECVEAADGEAAVEVLGSTDVDVVITDQWMPRMTGIELLRAIRENVALHGLPVLAVTTDDDTGQQSDLISAGASACITKPFSPERLLAAVAQLTEDDR